MTYRIIMLKVALLRVNTSCVRAAQTSSSFTTQFSRCWERRRGCAACAWRAATSHTSSWRRCVRACRVSRSLRCDGHNFAAIKFHMFLHQSDVAVWSTVSATKQHL